MKRNIWLDGIMGFVVGDALGVPAEFMTRSQLKQYPIVTMTDGGIHDQPVGTWSDDSSLTLATLFALNMYHYSLEKIMQCFTEWLFHDEYTAHGVIFDVGLTTRKAICEYMDTADVFACGCYDSSNNGNGSLMRILPMCLYCYDKVESKTDDDILTMIHDVSALTHGHMRSQIACGLYYFIVQSILDTTGPLLDRLQSGIDIGFDFYNKTGMEHELSYYSRLKDLSLFGSTPECEIKSDGYVVHTLEASIWSLLNSNTYVDCMITAVNLGDDTDTVAAVAGGLAGLFYGYDSIPSDWLDCLARRRWIESLCDCM